MNLPSLLIGFILGVMALWIYLELIALAAKRRVPPPTKAKRKQPNAQGENGDVNYAAMGATGLED